MKSIVQHASLDVEARWRGVLSCFGPVIFGLAAAIAITQGSWAALALLIAIPIVLMVPVEFAFGLLALAVPFDTVTGLGGSTLTISFLISAGAGGVLLARMLGSNCLASPPRAAKWFVLFFLWTALSTFWALHPELSNLRLPAAASLIALYFVAVSMKVFDREFSRVGTLIIFGGTIAALVSIFQFTRGITVSGRASIVFGGAATNSNELAASLILPLSLAIGGVISNRGVRRVLLLAASITMLGCTLLTMSRGALAALAVVAAVYFYRRGADKKLLVLLACGVLLIAFAPDLLRTRLHESLSSRGQGRWDIWLVGFEVVKHHGLIGVGLDNFPVAFQQYAGKQAVFRTYSVVPHNIYLQALAETGILGLFLLLGALRAQIKDIVLAVGASRASSHALMISYEAAAWGLLTHALVANLLWRKVFWFSWILIALAVQLTRRNSLPTCPHDSYQAFNRRGEPVPARPESVWPTQARAHAHMPHSLQT